MSNGLNEIKLIGNLGKDPEMFTTKKDKKLAKFSLAVNGYKDSTTWINIVCWEKLADLAEKYLKKGKRVFISGRLQSNNYEDKNGNMNYGFVVVATNLIFLDGAKAGKEEQVEEEEF